MSYVQLDRPRLRGRAGAKRRAFGMLIGRVDVKPAGPQRGRPKFDPGRVAIYWRQ